MSLWTWKTCDVCNEPDTAAWCVQRQMWLCERCLRRILRVTRTLDGRFRYIDNSFNAEADRWEWRTWVEKTTDDGRDGMEPENYAGT